MISISDINDAVTKLKKQNITPRFLIVGEKEWKDLCSIWAGHTKWIDENSKHNVVCGLKIIKLANIKSYFEIQ